MRVETPVRCAVVGTKNIAGKHIPVLQALPESTVVALCDIDAQAVSTAAHQFGVDKTFTSVESLQAWGEYDAVYVLVSVLAVADIAELFLRAGTPNDKYFQRCGGRPRAGMVLYSKKLHYRKRINLGRVQRGRPNR